MNAWQTQWNGNTWLLRPRRPLPGTAEAGIVARRESGEGPLERLRVARLRQVHGTVATLVSEAGCPGEFDALATRTPGLAVVVATADCLPVFLGDDRGGVALAHAGWRGLVDGVIESALARLEPRGRVHALLGPALGVCCFQVGDEVAARFPREVVQARRPRPHVDLALAATRRLRAAGIPRARISEPGPCTRCHQHLLYSHRGSGGDPARLLAYAVAAPVSTDS